MTNQPDDSVGRFVNCLRTLARNAEKVALLDRAKAKAEKFRQTASNEDVEMVRHILTDAVSGPPNIVPAEGLDMETRWLAVAQGALNGLP